MTISASNFAKRPPASQRVSIIVGKNGSGKSRFLVELAREYSKWGRQTFAISNTPYDRFSGTRGTKRISSAYGRRLPKKLLKAAIITLGTEGSSSLNAISETLSYCGYDREFALEVQPGEFIRYLDDQPFPISDIDFQSLRFLIDGYFSSIGRRNPRLSPAEYSRLPDLIRHMRNGREHLHETFDFRMSAIEFSRSRDLARLLSAEALLKKVHAVGEVIITLYKDGLDVDIMQASSGELTLIATFAFLATSLSHGAVILIDEPENSLHPQWQREYVDTLLDLLSLRNPEVVISTHAPLIVLGANSGKQQPQLYQVENKDLTPIDIDEKGGGIEETLWEVFNTVTPRNHFVSEQIADRLRELSENRITYSAFSSMIRDLKGGSFNDRQKSFFDATLELAQTILNSNSLPPNDE